VTESFGKTDQPSVKAYRVQRGEKVDWRGVAGLRKNGTVVVVDMDHAWVQFPEMQEPCKYPVGELRLAEVPPFREFVAARPDSCGSFQGLTGEPTHAYIARLADALADYADELRKRA
jgi:hypothetical protein